MISGGGCSSGSGLCSEIRRGFNDGRVWRLADRRVSSGVTAAPDLSLSVLFGTDTSSTGLVDLSVRPEPKLGRRGIEGQKGEGVHSSFVQFGCLCTGAYKCTGRDPSTNQHIDSHRPAGAAYLCAARSSCPRLSLDTRLLGLWSRGVFLGSGNLGSTA
jgi:hypothetical protein